MIESMLDKLHKKLFPNHPMYKEKPDDGRRKLARAVIVKGIYDFNVGDSIYINRKDWFSGDYRICAYAKFSDIADRNFFLIDREYIRYDSKSENSYSIVIEKHKKEVDGFLPDEDYPEDNVAQVKYSTVSTIVIESYLSSNEALKRATAMADALHIPKKETPAHLDVHVWDTLDDFGTGIRISIRPD